MSSGQSRPRELARSVLMTRILGIQYLSQ
jgi:hypothetical protein